MAITNPAYDQPPIWLKQAKCFKEIGDLQNAIKCYTNVTREVPAHIDAWILLSELYRELGDNQKALEVVTAAPPPVPLITDTTQTNMNGPSDNTQADPASLIQNMRLVLQKGQLYYELHQYKEFIETCLPTVFTSLILDPQRKKKTKSLQRLHEESESILDKNILLTTVNSIAPVHKKGGKKTNAQLIEAMSYSICDVMGQEKYFELVLELCEALASSGRYREAIRLVNAALLSLKLDIKKKAIS